ncbi:MAG: TIGR03808 family TAT-translocated repetitive protein, partial [Afipia sp.]|nr:TIGR03808 family TAT-translocated repetitive protein [Afipia sp.]
TSQGTNGISLTNLKFDGGSIKLAERRGLIHLLNSLDIRIHDCEIVGSGGSAIWLEGVAGEVRGNIIRKTAVTGLVSFDALGLLVAQNTIQGTSDNGIEILRNAVGDDGTIVVNNRIEDIKAGPGGSGQYGNAINAFRAGNVIVSGNRISNCDYSGVRGNSASNIQITGNSISNVREVALYSEFAFEGAIIANNTVDICAVGVSVANFNEGGRIAVVQGNIIRNILPKRPIGTAPDDDAGIGIVIEADAAVTGNVIENAPSFGIVAGWGKYLRDVAITGNVVRNAFIGIGVSVVPGAGTALVNNNLISGSARSAIVGLDHAKAITGELGNDTASRFAQIVFGGNAIR